MDVTRSLIYGTVGIASYPFLAWINKLKISGTAHLLGLPPQNVLFVCNHQTYFADVIALLHIFCAVKWGNRDRLGLPCYLLNPFTRVRYVAAEQTMRASWISRFFTLGGAITVKRAWNAETKETLRGLDSSGIRKITRALADNWVITFPQGTTTPFAPGRKGTAQIIKQSRAIVIPVVIGGFGDAFDKKGLRLSKRGTQLSVQFKVPLAIDYDSSAECILVQIMEAIEQVKATSHEAEV